MQCVKPQAEYISVILELRHNKYITAGYLSLLLFLFNRDILRIQTVDYLMDKYLKKRIRWHITQKVG